MDHFIIRLNNVLWFHGGISARIVQLPCNPWASYQPVCTQADQKAQEAQPAQRERERESPEPVISTGHQWSTGKTIVQALYLLDNESGKRKLNFEPAECEVEGVRQENKI